MAHQMSRVEWWAFVYEFDDTCHGVHRIIIIILRLRLPYDPDLVVCCVYKCHVVHKNKYELKNLNKVSAQIQHAKTGNKMESAPT